MTQITLPSGKVITQTYTAIHQPSAIVSNIGSGTETIARYEYNYESAGTDKRPLVKKKVLAIGTGIKTDYSYDAMSRLITNNSKDSLNNTVVGFEHTYDLVGNRKTDKHLHRLQDSETYGYDTALRFNDYKRGTIGGIPSFTQAYTLDKLANWTNFNNNGTIENRTHSVMNEITSINSQALTHDIKGSLTTNKNGDKYYWDKLNHLVEVRDASNNQIALYYYNADNLRLQKTTTTATEQYYYSGSRVVVETDGSQNIIKEYIHGGQYIDEVITVTTNSQTYFYLYDLRFNVYGLTDIYGNIVERIRYQGYGKTEFLDSSFTPASPFVNQPYTYTGQRYDSETGLMYFRLRYFDNELGRFISRDPIGYIDGMSLYRGYFVIGGLDPNGLDDIFGSESIYQSIFDKIKKEQEFEDQLKDIMIEACPARNNVRINPPGGGNHQPPLGDPGVPGEKKKDDGLLSKIKILKDLKFKKFPEEFPPYLKITHDPNKEGGLKVKEVPYQGFIVGKKIGDGLDFEIGIGAAIIMDDFAPKGLVGGGANGALKGFSEFNYGAITTGFYVGLSFNF